MKTVSFSRLALLLAPALLVGAAGTGCTLPQSDACAKYVDCQAHYDETYALGPTTTDDYTAEGVCWTSQTRADGCTDACNVANGVLLNGLLDRGDDPGPCSGS